MLWGWLLVGTLVIFAGMSLGEICSAFPTAGGLYYWSAKLAPGKSGPIWSWFTGWFNLLGQVAVTAGISFGCAFSISAFLSIWTGDAYWLDAELHHRHPRRRPLHPGPAEHLQRAPRGAPQRRLGVLAPHRRRRSSSSSSSGRPSRAATRPSGFLFGSEGWKAFEGLSGFSIPFYVFLIGLLNAQYTFTGYDASAHVSEETVQARISAPKGIVNSIWISMIAGFILLLAVSYAIPHTFPVTIGGVEYTGYDSIAVDLVPWATIFEFAAGRTIGLLLILVVIVAQFFCGMSSITANSRMVYAFSRDGAMPFSNFWHHVSKSARVPVRTAWFGAVGAFILALPYLYNVTAYAAVTSIAVIGLYISYLTPVFLRRINPGAFNPGPWVLSKTWGPIINWIAIVWVVFIVILLMLPQYSPVSPITLTTFNYAPIAVLVVVGGAGLWYARLGPQVVQGPEGPGYRRRARRDRARPQHLICVERTPASRRRGGHCPPRLFFCARVAPLRHPGGAPRPPRAPAPASLASRRASLARGKARAER